MVFEKQKQIYELIEKELQHLKNNEDSLIEYITETQTFLAIDEYINKQIYPENIKYYDKFISLITLVVEQIGLPNNSISYSQVVENLIMGGYLSLGYPVYPYRKLSDNKPLDIQEFFSFDVILRRGRCRHVAAIHKDIFDKLNLYCENYICCLFQENKEFHPKLSSRNYINGNHVANLITYHGLGDRMILCYIPVNNVIFNQIPYKQLLQNIEKFQDSSLKPHIDINELDDILLETNDRFYNSTKLLLDFRHEAEPYIKRIVKDFI